MNAWVRTLAAAAIAVLGALTFMPAQAGSVFTFDDDFDFVDGALFGNPGANYYQYSVDGFTATGIELPDDAGPLNPIDGSMMIWLDDNSIPLSNFLWIEGPKRFDAVSMDLFHFYFNGDRYMNMEINGVRDDAVVATTRFFSDDIYGDYQFGSAFSNLDRLEINVLEQLPRCPPVDYCSGVQLDNIRVAAVPLPATLGLMLTAIGGLGFATWRRRRG